MKSIKSITLFFEVLSITIALIILFIITSSLSLELENQMFKDLDSTMETIEQSINLYIHDRESEFEKISNTENVYDFVNVFENFSDIYYLDEDNTVVEIVKADNRSHLFKGYKISAGELKKFLDSSEDDKVKASPILRSVESDSVSLYMIKNVKGRKILGRIDLEILSDYLKRIATSMDSIIIIATSNGYIMTSSHTDVPLRVIPDETGIEIAFKRDYLLTKYTSEILNNDIVLLSPLERIKEPINIIQRFTPILVLAMLLFFIIKIIAQNELFLKPIKTFILNLNEYKLDKNKITVSQSVLKTKEIQMLYEAFHNKTEEIEDSFEVLNKTRQKAMEQVMQSEKLSSLGSLVAGVAHELNTPIGICVTISSYLLEKNKKIKDSFDNKTIQRQQFSEYLDETNESIDILSVNLNRASVLIQNFKQIAVEQSVEEKSKFLFTKIVETVISTLKHEYKRTNHKIKIDCDNNLEIYSYKGVYYQIFTNLIMNSIIHAFKNTNDGNIKISAWAENDRIFIVYEDDGVGIEKELHKRIFEPFFTTNRQGGGSGLGLHIVYNLITQKLNGKISFESNIGEGVRFVMVLPREIL